MKSTPLHIIAHIHMYMCKHTHKHPPKDYAMRTPIFDLSKPMLHISPVITDICHGLNGLG